MLSYKYFVAKDKLLRLTGQLSLSLSSSAIITANGEATKVMDSEKEETIKNCKRWIHEVFPCCKIELTKCAGQHGIMATGNITHKVDTIDHMITYQWSSKFNLWNALMEVNLKNFLTQKLPSIQ